MALDWRRIAFLALAGLAVAAGAAWLFAPKPALYAGVSFSQLVLDRNGEPLRLLAAEDERYRLFTPLDDIAPAAQRATLLYEDRRFHSHLGVDPLALLRAAWTTYVRRSRPVGASTITMQLARLRFGLDTRSPAGKLAQTLRALQIERHYDKAEILEAYLNLAPYGGAIEGIGTASRLYFDKPARALSVGEALALAVIPQNPSKRFPVTAQTAAPSCWRPASAWRPCGRRTLGQMTVLHSRPRRRCSARHRSCRSTPRTSSATICRPAPSLGCTRRSICRCKRCWNSGFRSMWSDTAGSASTTPPPCSWTIAAWRCWRWQAPPASSPTPSTAK